MTSASMTQVVVDMSNLVPFLSSKDGKEGRKEGRRLEAGMGCREDADEELDKACGDDTIGCMLFLFFIARARFSRRQMVYCCDDEICGGACWRD